MLFTVINPHFHLEENVTHFQHWQFGRMEEKLRFSSVSRDFSRDKKKTKTIANGANLIQDQNEMLKTRPNSDVVICWL